MPILTPDSDPSQDKPAFFRAFDEEIRSRWNDYVNSEAYQYGSPQHHEDHLNDIVDSYRGEETCYNWKLLPGAENGFALLFRYCERFEPDVDRIAEIEDFIEEIKEKPEALWYFIYVYKEGSKKVQPKPGLTRKPRGNQAVTYIEYGGVPEYEGAEVQIALSIFQPRNLFSRKVFQTIATRYLNAYAGDWVNPETGQAKGHYTSDDDEHPLNIHELKGGDGHFNVLYEQRRDNKDFRIDSSPYLGGITHCPICEGWFSRKAKASLTKEECEDMTKDQIRRRLTHLAGLAARNAAKARRERRELAKTRYEQRMETRIETDKRKSERRQKYLDRVIDRAFERSAKYGIDLSSTTYEQAEEIMKGYIARYDASCEAKKMRGAELTLEAIQLYFCEIEVSEKACNDLDE